MKNSTVLLSICIPTYDRVDYLVENLNVLIPQIEDAKYSVEVIISDNGTPEERFEELKKYVEKQKIEIKLFHHNENIGGRANFAYAVSKANGTYIFLLGDDDILSPNLLEILYPLIESQQYSLIHFNYLCADANLQHSGLRTDKYEGVSQSMMPGEFLKNTNYDPTFMSSIVFLKECWDSGLTKVRDIYYGYEWYGAICWGLMLKSMPCLFYFFPLCLQRNPRRIWAKDTPIFKYIGQCALFKDLDALEPGLYMSKFVFLKTIYYEKFFVDLTSDPSYYQKYERDFEYALPNVFYNKVSRCLHSPFYKFFHVFYILKMKAKLIEYGIRKLCGK